MASTTIPNVLQFSISHFASLHPVATDLSLTLTGGDGGVLTTNLMPQATLDAAVAAYAFDPFWNDSIGKQIDTILSGPALATVSDVIHVLQLLLQWWRQHMVPRVPPPG